MQAFGLRYRQGRTPPRQPVIAMYQPRHFEQTAPEQLAALMQAHPLAMLMHTDANGELQADPVPLLWQPGETPGTGWLTGHVARANPLWQAAEGQSVLAVFQGPQAYVSPNWYATKQTAGGKVVPTWNYAVVQARGRLQTFTEREPLLALLHALTDAHEANQPHPWSVDDAPADYVDSLLKAIVGFRIEVTELQGKWKVSQNRPAADRTGVAHGLAALPETPAQAAAMAGLVAGNAP
ncbi:FMN-binding negative transcriptional regulator [Ideonella azotifigens]|uniref:FMN-binding negative transcriptional regulator n=2 Tax=Ideonella azotifigens TaxID=513160 RepID=A0ABP3VIL5_9BURK|nr:FMN-binding negative transcriptional regulator [Ideonella azotifigens]MCD2342102.1 FMN-binding negative transcriptional regulator [Ideonella azotifigens]